MRPDHADVLRAKGVLPRWYYNHVSGSGFVRSTSEMFTRRASARRAAKAAGLTEIRVYRGGRASARAFTEVLRADGTWERVNP